MPTPYVVGRGEELTRLHTVVTATESGRRTRMAAVTG
jgi:hypothetical protein